MFPSKKMLIPSRTEKGGDHTVDRGLTVQAADVVGKIIENRQIVLDDDDIGVWAKETSDQSTSSETLLDIQE